MEQCDQLADSDLCHLEACLADAMDFLQSETAIHDDDLAESNEGATLTAQQGFLFRDKGDAYEVSFADSESRLVRRSMGLVEGATNGEAGQVDRPVMRPRCRRPE